MPYYEAPMIFNYFQRQSTEGILFATSKKLTAPGGINLIRFLVDSAGTLVSYIQSTLTQCTYFNNLRVRGQKIIDENSVLLLLQFTIPFTAQNLYLFSVNLVSGTAHFFTQSLPQFTGPIFYDFTTLAKFPKTLFQGDRDFFIAATIAGAGSIDTGSINPITTFLGQFTVSMIMTNDQSLTCQALNPGNIILTLIRDLMDDSFFVFSSSTQSGPFANLPTFYTSTSVTLTHDPNLSSFYQDLSDANSLVDLSAQCTQNLVQDLSALPVPRPDITFPVQAGNIVTQTVPQLFSSLTTFPNSQCTITDSTIKYEIVTVGTVNSLITMSSNMLPQSWLPDISVDPLDTKNIQFYVKETIVETGQHRYQRYFLELGAAPTFAGFSANNLIITQPLNFPGGIVTLPVLNFGIATQVEITSIVAPTSLNILPLVTTITSSTKQFELLVSTTPTTVVGIYQTQVSLMSLGYINGPFVINIQIVDTPPELIGCSKNTEIDQLVVLVGETLDYLLPPIQSLETYQQITVEVIDASNSKPLPFIFINSNDRLQISPLSDIDVGIYNLKLFIKDDASLFSMYYLKLEVKLPYDENFSNLGPPLFIPQLPIEPIRIPLGVKHQYKLPEIIDRDIKDLNSSISCKFPPELLQYIHFDTKTTKLNFEFPKERPATLILNRRYPMKFILNDHNINGEKKASYFLYIEVYDYTMSFNAQDQLLETNTSTSDQKFYSNHTSENGQKNYLDTFSVNLRLAYVKRNGKALIKLISNAPFGAGQLALQVTNKTFLIKVVKENSNYSGAADVDYEVVSCEKQSQTVLIQMKFRDTTRISQGQVMEQLEIRVIIPLNFTTKLFSLELSNNVTARKEIPPQFNIKYQKFEIAVSEYLDGGNINLSSSILVNFIIIILIQIVWSRLNDLSFLTINTMISMNVPGIIKLLQHVLYNLIFMDILQTDKWLLKAFYQNEVDNLDTNSLNAFFEENGFSSKQVLKNLGSAIIFIWVYFAIWIIIGILFIFKERNLIKLVYNFLLRQFAWNQSITLFLSQFCPLMTASLINLYDLQFDTSLHVIQSLMALSIIIITITITFVMIRIIKTGYDQGTLQFQDFIQRFGTFIESQSLENKIAVYWKILSLFRWLLTLVIMISLRDLPSFQIILLLAISLTFQMLQLAAQPFKEDVNIQFFNELMVSVYLYIMISLSDFNIWSPLRDQLGWCLLIIVMLAVFINLLKAVYFDFLTVVQLMKNLYKKYRGGAKAQKHALKSNEKTEELKEEVTSTSKYIVFEELKQGSQPNSLFSRVDQMSQSRIPSIDTPMQFGSYTLKKMYKRKQKPENKSEIQQSQDAENDGQGSKLEENNQESEMLKSNKEEYEAVEEEEKEHVFSQIHRMPPDAQLPRHITFAQPNVPPFYQEQPRFALNKYQDYMSQHLARLRGEDLRMDEIPTNPAMWRRIRDSFQKSNESFCYRLD